MHWREDAFRFCNCELCLQVHCPLHTAHYCPPTSHMDQTLNPQNVWESDSYDRHPCIQKNFSAISFQHRFKLLSIPRHSEICQITFEAFASFQLSTIWRFIIGGHVSLDLASSHICSISFHLSQYYSHSLGSLQFPGFLWKTICGSYFRLLPRNM